VFYVPARFGLRVLERKNTDLPLVPSSPAATKAARAPRRARVARRFFAEVETCNPGVDLSALAMSDVVFVI
jgi:hypothetical protein